MKMYLEDELEQQQPPKTTITLLLCLEMIMYHRWITVVLQHFIKYFLVLLIINSTLFVCEDFNGTYYY